MKIDDFDWIKKRDMDLSSLKYTGATKQLSHKNEARIHFLETFLAAAFLATGFLAETFLAATFLVATFLATTFLVTFLVTTFLVTTFLTAGDDATLFAKHRNLMSYLSRRFADTRSQKTTLVVQALPCSAAGGNHRAQTIAM